MDIMTLAAAKSYTDKKTANGGAADLSNYYTKQEIDNKKFITQDQLPDEGYVVDDSLTIDGAAADAKATGDRLTDIEYQTVTTDLAYEHKDLPEGEKTVTVSGDGVFGDTVIVGNFTNLIPNGGFSKSFPNHGITLSKKGDGYVITGATTTQSASMYFTDNMGNYDIPISADLIGKTLLHAMFADVANGNASLTVAFLNANKTQLSKVSDSLRNKTKEIVVPEETAYLRVSIYCSTNNAYNSEFKYYLIEKDKCQTVTLTDNAVEIQSISETEIHSVPYKHTVRYIVTLRKLIDDYAGGGKVTYITPEDFGAFGDGSTDDSTAISECLEAASQTGKMVIMAGRYFITSPITITQSGLEIICNDIVYNGTDCAVKIVGRENKIKIHSITSNGIGLAFEAIGQKSTSYNSVEVNTIASQSHGIAFIKGTSFAHQNTVKFELIRAGGSGCYGICFLQPEGTNGFIAECNFYGGQIANCEWAVYKVGGNSRCYGFEIEENVQGGFYTNETGGLIIYFPRSAESQRDGNLPFYKFTGTDNVHIYGSSDMPYTEIDLSEAIDVYTNASGQAHPLHESKFAVYEGQIIPKPHREGVNVEIPSIYTHRAYIWGKYLIMTPHMAYRKVVEEAIFDTRILTSEVDYDARLRKFSQLPTKFVVNTINTEIYLHESYCAFGFNEFEVEQANGFTCKIYDKLNNLIFDGTEQGDGLYKFNVYKDSTYCANHTTGLLRRDFTGHYWQVLKLGATIV